MADRQVTTIKGAATTTTVLKEAAIQEFKAALRG